MATSIGNYQPSLVLTETIAEQGIFPSRDSFNADMTLGMFHTYAFNFGMTSAPIAAGQLLAINQNQALFSLLGTTYGGDGRTTFALPDLRNHVVIGIDHSAGITTGQQLGSNTITLTTSTTPDRAPVLSVPAGTTSVIEQQGPVFITTAAATV